MYIRSASSPSTALWAFHTMQPSTSTFRWRAAWTAPPRFVHTETARNWRCAVLTADAGLLVQTVAQTKEPIRPRYWYIWPKHYQTKQVFAIAIAMAEFSTYLLRVNHAHYMFIVVYVFCTVCVNKFWLFRWWFYYWTLYVVVLRVFCVNSICWGAYIRQVNMGI